MLCAICGFETAKKNISITLTKDGKAVTFTDVPALVCPNCGEEYFENEVNKLLLNAANFYFQKLEPVKSFTYEEIKDIAA